MLGSHDCGVKFINGRWYMTDDSFNWEGLPKNIKHPVTAMQRALAYYCKNMPSGSCVILADKR